jgi:hypothetical protein
MNVILITQESQNLMMISKKILIPSKFCRSTPENRSLKFFSPRLVVIQVNQPIKFINQDENMHYLESVNLKGKPDGFFETGEIKSGQVVSIRLRNFKGMIPFACKFPPLTKRFQQDFRIT